ncbi:pre-peptidase C-terminal domain-containing protein [Nisaea sediminum]|uniref:pre-peptidase C-terminal domain-containing protein n=1 Tax=Nisaea sediminum TaxID=2775867 RepID=UPI001865BC8E|nr:pre-peptidase C-terminal domain-containing protein [Nisaea sediminum]
MGVWSVGIIDSGVTDETEARLGRNLYEYDFYYGNGETDGSRTTSHGSVVAESAEMTNAALERIDLQVGSNSGYTVSAYSVRSALDRLTNLHDAGWHIGSYNMSFASPNVSFSNIFQSQINQLANRGIFGVAASGNSGTPGALEASGYPAGLSNVISVGSHDGAGNPSSFSQNHPSTVHILADGEGFPSSAYTGTSFAAPQVAATVTTVQALVEGVRSDRLSFGEVIDVLQLGGAGPQSAADPANGATTYFLHTHQGSVDYTMSAYVDPHFSGLEYIASYADLEAVFGRDAAAARGHFLNAGVYEGRTVEFDGLEYVASHADLIGVFGLDRAGAAAHYLAAGRAEGRTTTFDADNYMAANPDLAVAFGGNDDLATQHYIMSGYYEGRSTGAPATGSVTPSPTPARQAVSEGATDLPSSTSTSGYVGVGQSVSGRITRYDRDWFQTELTAGQRVIIQLRGSASGGGSLSDPVLRVYNSSGRYLTGNDDGGTGLDSYLSYTPSTSGTYYLEADGFTTSTGSYTLSVTPASSATLASASDEPAAVEPAPEPVSDDIQLKTVGPEPVYTDWVY